MHYSVWLFFLSSLFSSFFYCGALCTDTVVQHKKHTNKYEKHFLKNVGGCRDGSAKNHMN